MKITLDSLSKYSDMYSSDGEKFRLYSRTINIYGPTTLLENMVGLKGSASIGEFKKFAVNLPADIHPLSDPIEVPTWGEVIPVDFGHDAKSFLEVSRLVSKVSPRNFGSVIHIDQEHVVGTDGFRLAYYYHKRICPCGFNIPYAAIKLVATAMHHDGNFQISEDKSLLRCNIPNLEVVIDIRLSEVRYPQYSGIFPRSFFFDGPFPMGPIIKEAKQRQKVLTGKEKASDAMGIFGVNFSTGFLAKLKDGEAQLCSDKERLIVTSKAGVETILVCRKD